MRPEPEGGARARLMRPAALDFTCGLRVNCGADAKLERMEKALRHEEPGRVPISDFSWGGFLARWRAELGLPPDTDIYRFYHSGCGQLQT